MARTSKKNGKEYIVYGKTREEAEEKLNAMIIYKNLSRPKKEKVKKDWRCKPKFTEEELREREKNRQRRAGKIWYQKNKERVLLKAKERKALDPEGVRQRDRESYAKNREAKKERAKRYRQENKYKYKVARKHRTHSKRNATPKWAYALTREKVKLLQAEIEAHRTNNEEYHIDHIVPIKGKTGTIHVVCGLHIDYNLQLLPCKENIKKSCYTWPDMWDYNTKETEGLRTLCANLN